MRKVRKVRKKQNTQPGKYGGLNTVESAVSEKSKSKFSKLKGANSYLKGEKGSAKKNLINLVAEKPPAAGYLHNTSIIAEKTGIPEWQMTAVEKMDRMRVGVSKKDLENLKTKTRLDYEKLAILLSTNRATLINKKGAELFSPALSERIVGIADVYSYGFEVFEDEGKFNEWVFRPNQALGGIQPFEMLDNQFGREEVKNVIGRIEYGVYS